MLTFLFMLLMQQIGIDLSGDSGLAIFFLIEMGFYAYFIGRIFSSFKKKREEKEKASEEAYYRYRRSLEGLQETYGMELGTHIYRERQRDARLAEAKARINSRRW